MIEHEQQLHPAADGKAVHGGDPRFRGRRELPARIALDEDSPHQLVDVAELTAHQEIHQ